MSYAWTDHSLICIIIIHIPLIDIRMRMRVLLLTVHTARVKSWAFMGIYNLPLWVIALTLCCISNVQLMFWRSHTLIQNLIHPISLNVLLYVNLHLYNSIQWLKIYLIQSKRLHMVCITSLRWLLLCYHACHMDCFLWADDWRITNSDKRKFVSIIAS